MITRIRIEAQGASAAEVESHLVAAADAIEEAISLDGVRGEQVILREMAEPEGTSTAFQGRLIVHPNVADDARQVAWLLGRVATVTRFGNTTNPYP